jgi:hypothetical protein
MATQEVRKITDVDLGDYILTSRKWLRVTSRAVAAPECTPEFAKYYIDVEYPTGDFGTIAFYGATTTAAAEGTVPSAFDPATLRRKAEADREKAAQILVQARRRELLADRVSANASRSI